MEVYITEIRRVVNYSKSAQYMFQSVQRVAQFKFSHTINKVTIIHFVIKTVKSMLSGMDKQTMSTTNYDDVT